MKAHLLLDCSFKVAGHLELDVEWLRLPPATFDAFDENDLQSASDWRLHALTHRPVSWLMPSFLQAGQLLYKQKGQT